MDAPVVDHPSTFGTRLAAARRATGLTQEQLGQGLGPEGRDLGKGAISSWEVDRAQPSAAQLTMLCQRLNTSADRLLGLALDNPETAEVRHG